MSVGSLSAASLFDAQLFVLAGSDSGPNSGIAERFLRGRLESLPRSYRVAFAAACAERQAARMHAAMSAGDREELGIGLDLVWESALHQSLDHRRLASLLRPCAELFRHKTPGEAGAARALLACLEAAQTGACEPVVRVSRYAVHLLEMQGSDQAQSRKAFERSPRSNPQVRLERERQYRDLGELRKTAAAPSVNLVRRLRDRAAMEARLPLDDDTPLSQLPDLTAGIR